MVKKVDRANKELKEAVKFLYKATEDYLHATLNLAKFHGSKKVREIRPHVLKIAKDTDKLYTMYVRKKK